MTFDFDRGASEIDGILTSLMPDEIRAVDIEPPWHGYSQRNVGLGVWSVHSKRHFSLDEFYRWKGNPLLYPHVTDTLSSEIVALILAWSPVLLPDWVITTPPQGASIEHTQDGMYPAGILAQSCAVALGLDNVTTLKRTKSKTRHHPMASLEQVPYLVSLRPPSVALVVDDMITSGTTLRFSLSALRSVDVPAFGFAWVGP